MVSDVHLLRYSAFDALQLGSQNDEYFQCENCNGEVVPESDKFAAEEMGDGSDNAKRQQREKLKDMFQKMEVRTMTKLLWLGIFISQLQLCRRGRTVHLGQINC